MFFKNSKFHDTNKIFKYLCKDLRKLFENSYSELLEKGANLQGTC